ncbi:hypothetical protein HK405_009056 [Cladochytrium tenue]|nr:hypothetical protein HK405_009056 [Cladochytrium tenue]
MWLIQTPLTSLHRPTPRTDSHKYRTSRRAADRLLVLRLTAPAAFRSVDPDVVIIGRHILTGSATARATPASAEPTISDLTMTPYIAVSRSLHCYYSMQRAAGPCDGNYGENDSTGEGQADESGECDQEGGAASSAVSSGG